jgi:hypothetical protein
MTKLSFAEARGAVLRVRRADWRATGGTLYVSPEGFADADDYLVVWGAREFLVDGDLDYLLVDNTVTFVSRTTGKVRDDVMVLSFDKVDGMWPIRVGDESDSGARNAPGE